MSDKINGIFKKKTIFLTKKKYSIKKVKDLFLKKRIDLIPVISKNKKILDILNYYNVNKKVTKKKKIKRIPSTAVVVVEEEKEHDSCHILKFYQNLLYLIKGRR